MSRVIVILREKLIYEAYRSVFNDKYGHSDGPEHLPRLLMNHPPLEERIAALRSVQ